MKMNIKAKNNPAACNRYDDARLLCETIHSTAAFGLLTFMRQHGGKQQAYNAPSFRYQTYADHALHFEEYAASGLEPFLLAGYGDGHGHADANILHTWVLCVDFDDGYPDFLATNELVRPTFLVETSLGRFHAGWLLDNYCSPAAARPVLKAMADRLGGDFAYAKVSQLMRLPGFENKKRGFVATLSALRSPAKTYSLDYLKQAFDVDLAINHIQHAVPLFDRSLSADRNAHDAATVATDAQAALEYLKSDADRYETWVSTLMALVPLGDKGMELAESFSRNSSKFDAATFAKKWNDVQKAPGHVATIFLRAQRYGWKNPGFRRNGRGTGQAAVTSRDLGRMIAAELGDNYSVIDPEDPRKLKFLVWDGNTFCPMTKTARRQVVEKVGKRLIAEMIERHLIDALAIKTLKLLLGTNRLLDEVCDHVADAMAHDSERRLVGAYPYFGLANGVLNTISQELVPSRYRPIPIARSPATFDPTASAPIFERTVSEIFEKKAEMIRFIYQLFGYMLVGKRTLHWLVIFYGESASNGKNTLGDLMTFMLGDYATTLQPTAIMTKSMVTDGATPTLAKLEGKRLAVISEPNDKHSIDAGVVKSLTGDKVASVRKIYEDGKDIGLDFLLLMLANKLPVVRDNDNGLWRRLKVVPFNRHFTEAEADLLLADKLKNEASGILNIMLAGARDYLVNGMQVPAEVDTAIKEQKTAVDPIAAFIADAVILEDECRVPLKTLYDIIYRNWAKQNPAFLFLSKRQFADRVEAKGFQKIDVGHLIYFLGITPSSEAAAA